MLITVIVPTYQRPKDLTRCLNSISKQCRLPNEVIVVVRKNDVQTWLLLESESVPKQIPIRTVTVSVTGVVAAMNAGLDLSQGDIIAFTDDDAAPHQNWLEMIEAQFAKDKKIGAVGGRDWVYRDNKLRDGSCHPGASNVVGKVCWYGKIIGNHHIGQGILREVDVLKGVNISYRKNALGNLRFDERMAGSGAQVHFELSICLALKKKGWKLIYDPRIGVDHYPGKRFDEDKRDLEFNKTAYANAVHNETLALLEYFKFYQRIVFIAWALIIGTRKAFGMMQWLRFLPTQKNISTVKWFAALNGRFRGCKTWIETNY